MMKNETIIIEQELNSTEIIEAQKMKHRLIEYSKEIGIDVIGFSNVEPFLFLETELKRREELGWSSGLTKGTIEERGQSIIVYGECKIIYFNRRFLSKKS